MFVLNRLALSLLITIGFANVAGAQTDWHGFYAGGSLGAAINRSTANTSSSFSTSGYFAASSVNALTIAGRQQLNDTAFTGGLEAGYNANIGGAVVGAETDYVSLRMNASQSTTSPYTCPTCAGTGFTITQSLSTRWLYTFRPRLAIPSGRMLYYADGGIAVSKLNYQETFSDTFGPANANAAFEKTKLGWTIGGGAAFRLNQERWSIKGEYLYTDFGRISGSSNNLTAFLPPLPFPANIFDHSAALHSHILRGGIDYHW